MTKFMDPNPSDDFPYTIFDVATGAVIDRCEKRSDAREYGPNIVVLRTA